MNDAWQWVFWAKRGVKPEAGGLNQQTVSWADTVQMIMEQEAVCRAQKGLPPE